MLNGLPPTDLFFLGITPILNCFAQIQIVEPNRRRGNLQRGGKQNGDRDKSSAGKCFHLIAAPKTLNS
jgi:hypothetical protein